MGTWPSEVALSPGDVITLAGALRVPLALAGGGLAAVAALAWRRRAS